MPGMFICSIVTFIIISLFDSGNFFPASKNLKNLIFSDTFLPPGILNLLFKTNVNYIDGAYWTIFVEIIFYLIVSTLYFWDRKNLFCNYLILTLCTTIIYLLFTKPECKSFLTPILSDDVYIYISKIVVIFKFPGESMWFLLGMALLELYKNKSNKYIFSLFTGFFIFQIMLNFNKNVVIFFSFLYVILILFIYKPSYVSFLGSKYISNLGIASYSGYLIHQNIGVLFINKFSFLFGNKNWLLPIICMCLFCLYGLYSYRYLEKPIETYLRKVIIRKSKL
jgi:peptidoglycan/LPS O-acetylase OafA/YrhL